MLIVPMDNWDKMKTFQLLIWWKFILVFMITLISEKDAIEEHILKSVAPKYTYKTEWYEQQVITYKCNFFRFIYSKFR